MKTVVFSNAAESGFSDCELGFRERDELFEQLHPSIEFISRGSPGKVQLAVTIDVMHLVLNLEVDSTIILVAEVLALPLRC